MTRIDTISQSRLVRLTIGVAALAVIGMVVVGLSIAARDTDASFVGTDLGPNDPAPNFRLTDHSGNQISLAEQRGNLVVLTFLYTQCPDVCPLTAAWLRQVYEQLGTDAEEVTFLAVSVDPERDTVEAAFTFSERYDMVGRWSYLVGSRQELEPIWKDYYVGVLPDPNQEGQVMHTAPIYLIDRDGRRRVLHTTGGETNAIVGEIVRDLRTLLAQ